MSQAALQSRSQGETSFDAATIAPPPSRELLSAWLLMLLDRQASHGYELRRQLEAHGVTAESGAMYRVLRKLEEDGCAASTWAKSIAGPRRRLYELTAQGRSELGKLVATITAKRDVHAAFLTVHDGELG
jgi:DNA-binding PadR family transcriptional regulator